MKTVCAIYASADVGPGCQIRPQSRDKLRKGNQRTRIKANISTYSTAERLGQKQSSPKRYLNARRTASRSSAYLAPEAVETLLRRVQVANI